MILVPLLQVGVEIDRGHGHAGSRIGAVELDRLAVHLDRHAVARPSGERPHVALGQLNGVLLAAREHLVFGRPVLRDDRVHRGVLGDRVGHLDAGRSSFNRLGLRLRGGFAAFRAAAVLRRVGEPRHRQLRHILVRAPAVVAEHEHQHHDEQHEDHAARDDERQLRLHDARGLRPCVEVRVLGVRQRRMATGMRASLGIEALRTPARAVIATVVAPVVVHRTPERILPRRALVDLLRGASALPRGRASRARRSSSIETRGLRAVARASHLVGVGLVQVHARHLGGVEPHEARVGVHHVARVAARRHAGEIVFLDSAQDVGPDAQPSRSRREIVALALARLSQYGSECHLATSLFLRVRRVVRLEGLQRLELHGVYEHFAGLAAVRRPHDALFLQHVHYTPSARIAHLQAALDVRG